MDEEKKVPDLHVRKTDKIVSGSASIKKKSEFRKFVDLFVAEDVSSIKDYILVDVLVPSIRKAIYDIIVNGLDFILPGAGNGVKKTFTNYQSASRISYDRPSYSSATPQRTEYSSQKQVRGIEYNDIIFEVRNDAVNVLAAMDEICNNYKVVSIFDMYDAADLPCEYTYDKYGWTDIHTATIVKVDNGWAIKLPKATKIK